MLTEIVYSRLILESPRHDRALCSAFFNVDPEFRCRGKEIPTRAEGDESLAQPSFPSFVMFHIPIAFSLGEGSES